MSEEETENARPFPQISENSDQEKIPQLPEQIARSLQRQGIDPDDPQVALILSQVAHFQGPMPHPDIMAGYNEIYPQAAELIFSNFESQSEHRRHIEKKQVLGSEIRQYVSQVSSFLIALSGLGISGYLGLTTDRWLVPIVIALVAVGGPSTATILSRWIAERYRD